MHHIFQTRLKEQFCERKEIKQTIQSSIDHKQKKLSSERVLHLSLQQMSWAMMRPFNIVHDSLYKYYTYNFRMYKNENRRF